MNKFKRIKLSRVGEKRHLTVCLDAYDSYIISGERKPSKKELKQIVYWDEWACNFREALKSLEIKEIHTYMNGGAIFKMILNTGAYFHIHFANRNPTLKGVDNE